jgi:general secretion pathway protein K
MTTRRRDSGFALLIVLWTMVLLALLVTQLTLAGRTEARLARNLRMSAATEAAADGGVREAIFHLMDGGKSHWAPSGSYRVAIGGTQVDIVLENYAGRLNPNLADPTQLASLMRVLGVDQRRAGQLAAAIIDWRSPNLRTAGAPSTTGAKAPQYRAAGLDYGPPGAPFRDEAELGLVLGMTPDVVALLRPHISVWWDGDPDPLAADAQVLAAMRLAAGGAGGGVEAQVDAATRLDNQNAPPTSSADAIVAGITARAAGPGGSRFERHAVVQITFVSNAKRWRIVAWDPPSW